MKQTAEDRGIARVSLEWRDLEYDTASMYTREAGSKRLDFLSHLDPRRAKRMEGHNGEWSRDVWATATEVQIDPSKVNGPGGSRRDLWHVPPELHVAAATPKMCMCPSICYHEVFNGDNLCEFCSADAANECE